MSDPPVSQMYKNYGADTWKDYDVQQFEGVTPKSLHNKHKLDFARNGNRDFTDTEKSVWYSHFELWCHCAMIRESIVILEHDAVLQNPLPNFSGVEKKFIAYQTINDEKYISPGCAYYITYNMAAKLIARAVCKDIHMNSDGHLVNELKAKEDKHAGDFYYVEQIKIDNVTTIDHLNAQQIFVR